MIELYYKIILCGIDAKVQDPKYYGFLTLIGKNGECMKDHSIVIFPNDGSPELCCGQVLRVLKSASDTNGLSFLH